MAADFKPGRLGSPLSERQIAQDLDASTSLPAASGNCGDFCGIEAPGGVQFIYWQPDALSNQSGTTAPIEPYTQVQDGFTL